MSLKRPNVDWMNSVLMRDAQVDEAIAQLRTLGLPVMKDRAKNWDSLAALDAVLKNCAPTDPVFDAGGEVYSQILPWLSFYGFKNLTVGNVSFTTSFRRGAIRYEYADITETGFEDQSYQAITCLSVVEHGVDRDRFFRESSRLLRDQGLLVLSTDYFETKIDCRDQNAFGTPIHVFDKQELLGLIKIAESYGLQLTSRFDPSCDQKVVHWRSYDLRYTFVVLGFRKGPDGVQQTDRATRKNRA